MLTKTLEKYINPLLILNITQQDMIKKLQSSKGKRKLKKFHNIGNFYDEMNIRKQRGNFQFEEDTFSKGAQGICKIVHEK